jgi:hypothetical protein
MEDQVPASPKDLENDIDDTPIEELKASLRRALQKSKSDQRIPMA